jgi:hypothetical protein
MELTVGALEGESDGSAEGMELTVGCAVGVSEGLSDGIDEAVGVRVGASAGGSVGKQHASRSPAAFGQHVPSVRPSRTQFRFSTHMAVQHSSNTPVFALGQQSPSVLF